MYNFFTTQLVLLFSEVAHESVHKQIVEEIDYDSSTANLQNAAVVKPIQEATVVHDEDTAIWRPDEKSKIEENKEVLEQLKTLAELKDKGALTEEEFERKKKELLG